MIDECSLFVADIGAYQNPSLTLPFLKGEDLASKLTALLSS